MTRLNPQVLAPKAQIQPQVLPSSSILSLPVSVPITFSPVPSSPAPCGSTPLSPCAPSLLSLPIYAGGIAGVVYDAHPHALALGDSGALAVPGVRAGALTLRFPFPVNAGTRRPNAGLCSVAEVSIDAP